MTSIIERYWQRVFFDYQVAPRKFVIPEFPDPMISADFEKQNLIEDKARHKSFRLGVSQTRLDHPGIEYKNISLASAAKSDYYNSLMLEGFPHDYVYLKKLTAFLLTTRSHYFNLTLGDAPPYAMVNLAISEDIALIFNGVVTRSKHKQGLAGRLVDIARYEAHLHGAKEIFFWTRYDGLLRYSEYSAFNNIKTNV